MGKTAPLRVLHAPDYRQANAYQEQLAQSLAHHGVESCFPNGYRRGFPITRMVQDIRPDILHLHWPEAYFQGSNLTQKLLRILRFYWDIKIAAMYCLVVWTAHNFIPHNTESTQLILRNIKHLARLSKAIICHNLTAKEILSREFPFSQDKIRIISHGNCVPKAAHSIDRTPIRKKMGIAPNEFLAVNFGRLSKYKRIEDIAKAANSTFHKTGGKLLVVGESGDDRYMCDLKKIEARTPALTIYNRFLSEEELNEIISASDACVFAHSIQSSGSALYARLSGKPIIVPEDFCGLPTAEDVNDPAIIHHNFQHSLQGPVSKIKQLTSASINKSLRNLEALTSWEQVSKQHFTVYKDCIPANQQ